jgi:hypothetical protein
MALTVTRKGDVLRIELSLEKPQLSKSGKTMIVASTHGVKTTDVQCDGRNVVVVANAFFYPKKKPSREG